METTKRARSDLARKILAPELNRTLEFLFKQKIGGVWLCGGTALSGFYAGHRRSDDLDLFSDSDNAQKGCVLAVKSLGSIGARFSDVYESSPYFRATTQINSYYFSLTVVRDPNLFRVGKSGELENGIRVADLTTLLKMKAATLVSRCSEKDLYDLIWLFGEFQGLTFGDLISLGNEIDAGVTGEAMLLGLSGALLREDSCDFSLDRKIRKETIYKDIIAFKKKMEVGLSQFLRKLPGPPLESLVKKLGPLKKGKISK